MGTRSTLRPRARCGKSAKRVGDTSGPSAKPFLRFYHSDLHYYFIKPLEVAKAGFLLEQSASIGMAGVQQVIATVVRNIIRRMDGPQLLSIGDSLRQFMR